MTTDKNLKSNHNIYVNDPDRLNPRPKAKISIPAVLAFALSIICIVCYTQIFGQSFFNNLTLIVIATAISAIIISIASMVMIKKSKGKLRGKTISITGLIISSFLLILTFYPPYIVYDGHGQAYDMKQRAQLHSIDTAMEFFKSEFNGYPPSDALDSTGRPYCGVMKLCEAMMGQDLKGFHPDSIFRRDGTDNTGKELYPKTRAPTDQSYLTNISSRKGPYLPLENANAYQLMDLFEDVGPFDGNNYIMCDVYRRVTNLSNGKRIGMPILYYRADTSKTAHDINDPNNPDNIYNYKDNHALLALGVPGQPGKKHPLFEDSTIFYKMTRDYRVTTQSKPNRADTYILLSAGKDSLYGTKDDIVKFDMGWKPK